MAQQPQQQQQKHSTALCNLCTLAMMLRLWRCVAQGASALQEWKALGLLVLALAFRVRTRRQCNAGHAAHRYERSPARR
jgi:MYXO-CTERM domain-containing protein